MKGKLSLAIFNRASCKASGAHYSGKNKKITLPLLIE
ncbi:hypothetical protein CHRYSEOSP005_31340 [Chryseobacterium sp. Alg-005]